MKEFTVEHPGERLDHCVATHLGCSHAAARRLVENGQVRVNGRLVAKGAHLQRGDQITLAGPLPGQVPLGAPEQSLVVLYQDDELIALDKPPGIPSHPLRPDERDTLVNALVARFPECALASDDPREGGLCHRLDRDTSGVILAARSRPAWEALRSAFQRGAVEKRYLALVAGEVGSEGTIDLPLAHDPANRRRMIPVREPTLLPARAATTRYRPLHRANGYSFVEAITTTGRMHQVRVHLAAIGHPLVGDLLYGGPPELVDAPGHFLHAAHIRFPHPQGEQHEVAAPLPSARRSALVRLTLYR